MGSESIFHFKIDSNLDCGALILGWLHDEPDGDERTDEPIVEEQWSLLRLTAGVIGARRVERQARGVAATGRGAGASLAIGTDLVLGAVRAAVGEGQRLLKAGEGELGVGIDSTGQRFGLNQIESPLVIEHRGHRGAAVTPLHDKLPAIDPVDPMREVEL